MMKNKTITFLTFVFGLSVGSIATWYYVKKKYEQIAQEEIESVKEVFYKRKMDITDETEDNDVRTKADHAKEKPGVVEYTARLHKHGYTKYSNIGTEDEKKEKTELMDKPYVIPPEEFGEFDDYDKISLTYYADQILADDNDEIVDDVEGVVGFESLNSFGEYEDDSVFVRNDRLKCDYEILLDHRKYSDVIKKNPHQIKE